MTEQLTDCQKSLRDQVKHIAETLKNPPMADGYGTKIPDDAVECHGNPQDYVWVTGYDRKVPDSEISHDKDLNHFHPSYIIDEENEIIICRATGQTWEGAEAGYWWSVEDDLILGGEELTDVNPMSAYDYLSDVLDIEYRVGHDRSYRSALIMVACGGPNIWIDTKSNKVIGAWWSDYAEASYEDEMGLDDALEEIFNCG